MKSKVVDQNNVIHLLSVIRYILTIYEKVAVGSSFDERNELTFSDLKIIVAQDPIFAPHPDVPKKISSVIFSIFNGLLVVGKLEMYIRKQIKILMSTGTDVRKYLSFLESAYYHLDRALKVDGLKNQRGSNNAYRFYIKIINDLVKRSNQSHITVTIKDNEFKLSGLEGHSQAGDLKTLLVECALNKKPHEVIDTIYNIYKSALACKNANMATPNIWLLPSIDCFTKTVKTNPFKVLPNDLTAEIIRRVPLDSMLSISLVCNQWRTSARLPLAWQHRLHENFGFAWNMCILLQCPHKVYRRLHRSFKFSTLIWDIRSNFSSSKKDILHYPEIFYPYLNGAKTKFNTMLKQASRYQLQFWLNQATLIGNLELTKKIFFMDKTLISDSMRANGVVSGEIALTKFFLPTSTPSARQAKGGFRAAIWRNNLTAAKYLHKIWGELVVPSDSDDISHLFALAVKNTNPHIIRYLQEIIYPNFSFDDAEIQKKSENIQQQQHDHILYILSLCAKESFENCKYMIESLNINVNQLSKKCFTKLTRNVKDPVNWAYLFFLYGTITVEDYSSYFRDFGSKYQYAFCLFLNNPETYESNAPSHPDLPEHDSPTLLYCRISFAIERNDLPRFQSLVIDIPSDHHVGFIRSICDKLLTCGNRMHMVECVLINCQIDIETIVKIAALPSQRLFELFFDFQESFTISDEILAAVIGSDNLRLAQYIFEDRGISIPENWDKLVQIKPYFMRDYIAKQYQQQQDTKNAPQSLDI